MYYTYVRNRKKYKGRECMDFANRNSQQNVTRPASEGSVAGSGSTGKKDKKPNMARVALVSLLFLGTLLVVALVLWISTANDSNSSSSKFVNDKQLQAVFLNNGQVYFGNIVPKNSNSKYLDLKNIYYLRTDSSSTAAATTSANNISLVKLGCELHGPTDEMLINVSQLTFWENLKSDGQVAKAIATYKQQNPNGQSCSTASSSTGTQTTPSATTPTNNSGTTTTGGTTTTKP
jgi:hypothetical protein